MKLPGRNESAHTLDSAEIVACALGELALLELMLCVAHAGKITATTSGKRPFISKVNSPVLNNMSVRRGCSGDITKCIQQTVAARNNPFSYLYFLVRISAGADLSNYSTERPNALPDLT
jgi:hypothetical protein